MEIVLEDVESTSKGAQKKSKAGSRKGPKAKTSEPQPPASSSKGAAPKARCQVCRWCSPVSSTLVTTDALESLMIREMA